MVVLMRYLGLAVLILSILGSQLGIAIIVSEWREAESGPIGSPGPPGPVAEAEAKPCEVEMYDRFRDEGMTTIIASTLASNTCHPLRVNR